jgi:hypothetical protein
MSLFFIVVEGLNFYTFEIASHFVIKPKDKIIIGIVNSKLAFRGDIGEVTDNQLIVD